MASARRWIIMRREIIMGVKGMRGRKKEKKIDWTREGWKKKGEEELLNKEKIGKEDKRRIEYGRIGRGEIKMEVNKDWWKEG